MRLVILAAGAHERLPGLEVPKALIEFGGLTITEMVIRDFAAEVKGLEVGICVGHEAEKIVERIGDECHGVPVHYFHNPEYATTGAAWSLFQARDFLTEECVVMEGDHLLHPDLIRLLVHHPVENAILVDTTAEPEYGEETLVCGRQGRVWGLQWPASESPPDQEGWVIGEAIVMSKLSHLACQVLVPMLGRGEIIDPLNILMGHFFHTKYIDTGGLPWIEIDTPADLERAERIYQTMKGDKGGTKT